MTTSLKAGVGVGVAAIIVLGGYFLLDRTASPLGFEEVPSEGTATSSVPGSLPPEPLFVLPPGAVVIDDYAFTLNGGVFFRSVTSTSSLPVPEAHAKTFKRISTPTTYPGNEIVEDCGVSGTYAFYSDQKSVYLYQVWRAPTFRSGRVEILQGADPKYFAVLDSTHVRSAGVFITLGYQRATTTCSFILSK